VKRPGFLAKKWFSRQESGHSIIDVKNKMKLLFEYNDETNDVFSLFKEFDIMIFMYCKKEFWFSSKKMKFSNGSERVHWENSMNKPEA